MRRINWSKVLKWTAIGFVVLLLAIQLVPYGRDHSNPAVAAEPAWDSPRTRELARVACFDCHSNETTWPWYSNIAPISWWTQNHVDEGRRKLNFSEWGREQETDEIVESIEEGDMPPRYYTIIHGPARLSAADEQALVDGFVAMFGRGKHDEGD